MSVNIDPEVREAILSVLKEEQNRTLSRHGKIVLVALGILIILLFYWTRFQVVEVHSRVGFYKLNRLTGNIEWIYGDEIRNLN